MSRQKYWVVENDVGIKTLREVKRETLNVLCQEKGAQKVQRVKIVVDCCIKTDSEMKNSESQGLPLGLCSLKVKPNLSCVKCSSPLTP